MRRGYGLYAVIGKPIAHSRSPEIFQAAFAKREIHAKYFRLASQDAMSAFSTLTEMGVDGFNATAPYKEALAGISDSLMSTEFEIALDTIAAEIGAVNTVKRGRRGWTGHNTDAVGVVKALESACVQIKGADAVILGAGGAARAAAYGLVRGGARTTVAARRPSEARAVARTFGCEHVGLTSAKSDAVIAASSIIVGCAGTKDRIVRPSLLKPSATVMDANYRERSALASDAAARGCRVVDGRDWLVHQGAESFRIFTGKDAPVAAMRRAAFASWRRPGRNIVLTGFMGAGKTAVGKVVASRTRQRFVDLDVAIQNDAGESISNIFASQGERAFRAMESKALVTAIKSVESVISAGGGVVTRKGNLPKLARAKVAYLWADAETIAARLRSSNDRPLMKKRPGIRSIEAMLHQREPLYLDAADIVVDARRAMASVAEVIADEFA